MTHTDNLNLNKPEKAEQYSIDLWNENCDIIDSAITTEKTARIASDTNLQTQIDENRYEERRIGTVPISKGGTGNTTAQDALNALHDSVEVKSAIDENAEITFVKRTAADITLDVPESIDVESAKLSTIAEKVYELIRGDSAIFSATKNGLVPKSAGAGSSTYLNATGTWDNPSFAERQREIANSQEISFTDNTIFTFTATQALTVVLNDGAKKGLQATFFNPTAFNHTFSLSFFGGNSQMIIKAGAIVKLWWTGSEWFNFALSAKEIGSLYWSSDSTNPQKLFGGTWTQIKDRVIYAQGSKAVNSTGGAETATLTTSNMPSHTHTFTPSGTITMNAHSHGLNNHTHTWSNTHNHSITDKGHSHSGYFGTSKGNRGGSYSDIPIGVTTSTDFANTGISINNVTISGTTSGNSGNTTSTTSTGKFTGSAGTTGANGSGSAFSILPPYVVKYCFERTA